MPSTSGCVGAATARRKGVLLPTTLSVSQLVEMRRDPDELARSLRRPVPQPPRPQARRGTRFHLWLEETWGQQRLLDVDELPGAADETAPVDDDLAALQEAFRASDWWARTPHELEVPFDLKLAGLLLRGRIDAVFTDDPDGYVDVVDWKTGRPKTGEDAAVAAVQLAVYRLAWHHLSGVPLDRIRAAFHYVAHNRTDRRADLLGHDELIALIRSVPEGGCRAALEREVDAQRAVVGDRQPHRLHVADRRLRDPVRERVVELHARPVRRVGRHPGQLDPSRGHP